MKRKRKSKSKNKSKNVVTIFFLTIGILGLVLLIFGSQFNGTLCDDIQTAGLTGLGIFAIWAVAQIAATYMTQKELDNL